VACRTDEETSAMTNPDVSVHFLSLHQAAEDVRIAHNNFVQQKADLETFLTKLNDTWWGGASASAMKARKDWNDSADEVFLILANLYQTLDDAHHNYTTRALGLEQMWGG
jgi:uncharacterized protein YukE